MGIAARWLDVVIFKAIIYRYEWAQNPITDSTVWQGTGSSIRKMVISNLEPGTNYWFRVRAYGTKQQQTVSDEVSGFVMPRSTNKAAYNITAVFC